MKHFKHDAAKVVPGEGYTKKVLIDESALGIPGSFIQEVEFRRGETVRQHHHRYQTEIFYALDEAPFLINGMKVTMSPGDILVCEPGDVHGNPVISHDFRILVLKVGFRENDIYWD
ncbi:MAG TPA: cupin domain-containing protein [Methanomassiliicoccales archaeon]|jgi:quercetin dioxygenase-like cupin family protein